MKHRDLLGITVHELMDNYVCICIEQDNNNKYYVGIIDINDVDNLPQHYMTKEIFTLPLLHDILTGEVLDLGDLND